MVPKKNEVNSKKPKSDKKADGKKRKRKTRIDPNIWELNTV